MALDSKITKWSGWTNGQIIKITLSLSANKRNSYVMVGRLTGGSVSLAGSHATPSFV
jgi:hypothetical protein